MYNIAICDDILSICEEIKAYIEDFLKIYNKTINIYIATDAKNLYELLEKEKINLLFLDIELPSINGIEIGKFIRKTICDDDMQIVYISGKEDYCIKLFDVRPMNFLKKPICREDIYNEVREALRLNDKMKNVFVYSIGKEKFFQPIEQIMYFEIVKRKIKMVCTFKEIYFYGNIGYIEDSLCNYNFISIHKSFLININKIQKYASKELTMIDGKIIPISRSKRDMFLNKILNIEREKVFNII